MTASWTSALRRNLSQDRGPAAFVSVATGISSPEAAIGEASGPAISFSYGAPRRVHRVEPSRVFRALTKAMAPRRTRERLQHDRKTLRKALSEYEAGAMAHLDELEQARVIESIARRIADLDAKIDALGGA